MLRCGTNNNYSWLLSIRFLFWTDICQDVGHRSKRDMFDQCASRKHFITKQDISNVCVNIKDNAIIRHKSDPMSVYLLVSELQEEFDPILLFKPQDEEYNTHYFTHIRFCTYNSDTVSTGVIPKVRPQDSLYWCHSRHQCLLLSTHNMHCARWIWKGYGRCVNCTCDIAIMVYIYVCAQGNL